MSTPPRELVRSRSTPCPRALALFAGAALCAGAALPASAQVSTWANNVNGTTVNWNNAASWAGGVIPTSGIDAALVFNYNFGSTSQTASNNIGAFSLNSITVNNDAAGSSSGGFTISGSSAVSFNTSSGSVGPTLTDGGNIAATMSVTSVVLNAPLTINGSGFGNLTITSTLSGANGGLNLNATGPGLIALNGFNTFFGPVVVNSGEVGLGSTSSPFGDTSNAVTINGGSIRFGGTTTVAQNISLNSNLIASTTSGSSIQTLSGIISGAGGIVWRPSTGGVNGALTLQGANTFTGAVLAQPRGNGTTNITLSGGAGSMASASSYTLTDAQTLMLDNSGASANNNNRLSDTAPIALNRAVIDLRGNASVATAEAVGPITFAGGATLVANLNQAAQNTTLNAASITRASRGTLLVQGNSLGTAGGPVTSNIVTGTSLTPALAGGGGGAGSAHISILPYAFAVNANPTANTMISQLVTYDNTVGFRPLAASEYASVYQSQGSFSADNLRSTTSVTIGGNTRANALVLDTAMISSAGAATTGSGLYMKPGSVLTPASGVVLSSISNSFTSNGFFNPSTLPSIVAGGTLDFGATEGIVHTQNNTAIFSTVAGSQGLTKGGYGGLILAAGNTFTGPVTVNIGSINVDADSALGDASNSVTLACGNFQGGTANNSGVQGDGIAFVPSLLLGTSMQQSLTIPRNINLVGAGGGIGAAAINTTLTESGTISGSGALYTNATVSGNSGVLKLTGANTYTGPTIVSGNVAVNNDSNLGVGGEIILAGGALRNDGPFTTNRNILAVASSGTSTLLTNGADATLNGVISNQNSSQALVKGGTNALNLTAASPFSGTLQIGQTQTQLVGGQSQFVTGGTVALSGAGALPSVNAITVNSSSTLTLDNTGTNLANRTSSNVPIGGGTLNFLGNSGADSTETIGTLTYANSTFANGTAVVNIAPGAGQGARLTVSDLAKNPGASLLVRGPSLGGAFGANTANLIVNTATTGALAAANFANGCIGGVAVDTSLSGNGTDLANYVPGTGITAATYGAGDGFSATGNSDLTGPHALSGATAANAIRISEGGGIDTNGFVLTMGAPATILANGPTAKTIGATGGGSIAFPASSSATIWNNSDLTINAPMTGLTSLNKSGIGTLTLNAASAGTTTVVSNGTLKLGGATLLPAAANLVVGSQGGNLGTLDLNGFSVTAGSLSGIGNVVNNGGLTLTGSSSVFAGMMTGSGGLTISGSTLIDGASSTYSGDTVVRNGAVLTIGADQGLTSGPLGGGGNLVVGDATTGGSVTVGSNVSVINKNFVYPASTAATAPAFTPVAGNNVVINGSVTMSRNVALSGSGGSLTSNATPFYGKVVTYNGTIQDGAASGTFEWAGGSINLMSANTFSGGVTAHPGSADPETCFLGIGDNGALGTGTYRVSTAAGGNLLALGSTKAINNGFYWTTASASRLGFAGVNDLTLSGNVDLGGGFYASASPASLAGPRTLNVINAGVTTLAGQITGTSAASLTKSGGGKLVMTGANTFAGNVLVNAGTLLVNGSNSGAGSNSVAAGAILGGTGSITGPLSIASGGIIEPGASAGTLSVGALTVASGSVLTYELASATTVGGGVNDLVAVNGALALPASGVVVNVLALPGLTLQPGGSTYTLMTYAGGITGSAASFQLGFAPGFVTGATFDTTSVPGSVLMTVVPTPGSLGLLALAGVFASRRRRAPFGK